MRDDFDAVVADHFKVLDDVPVPDTWSRVLDRVPAGGTRSRVPFSDESMTLIDLETPVPTQPHRRGPRRIGVAALVAAATVLAIVIVTTHDAQNPADEPAPTVNVPPTPPPRALFGMPDERLASGTYYVDEVDGTPTPRIFITIGAGWLNFIDGEGIAKWVPADRRPQDDVGFITFSRPNLVYLDACRLSDGFVRGSVTTLDGLVAALGEQGGWAEVTAPADISIDGYPGKTFQRTVPAVLSRCKNNAPGHMRLPELDGDGLKSWQDRDSGFAGGYYEPGQRETLLLIDIHGTVVVISANLWAGTSAADRAEFATVLDSIGIDEG